MLIEISIKQTKYMQVACSLCDFMIKYYFQDVPFHTIL